MKPNNPFLISGYYSPEYFCDRNRESQTIINALYNGRGITLIAPRRIYVRRADRCTESDCRTRASGGRGDAQRDFRLPEIGGQALLYRH